MRAIQMKGISKHFSGVQALQSVDFEVQAGEIHALLGANGAGKSTLMKIITGAYHADEGEIRIDGETVTIKNPEDAKRWGVQCVYQEVDAALIPTLDVAENILLNRFVDAQVSFPIRWDQLYDEANEIVQRLGFSLSVHKKVEDCTLSEKQLILIARAIAQKAKYIVFDEPTAPLSTAESEKLFQLIRQLRHEQVGIIYISHRLPEVFELSDRITVMRDGRHICTKPVAETSFEGIISDMLGHTLQEEFPPRTPSIGGLLLDVKGVSHGKKLQSIDIQVKEGEVVAVVGLVGAGKTELARRLFGADSIERGEIRLKGKKISLPTPRHAVHHGIVLVPEERRKEGLIVEESVKKNLSLASLKKWTSFFWIQSGKEYKSAQEMVKRLGIKTAGVDLQVHSLSGGNQQKVVIGKWLHTDAHIYLFDEPTKGVDIGAKREIYSLIGQLAAEKKGILYFTCEFQEALGIADRILVMHDGKIVKEVDQENWNQEQLLYYASGGC